MRSTRTVVFIVFLVSLLLPGCGGGGGGDSGAGASDQIPVHRDRLFAEEAIQRVRDRTHVRCQSVTCDGEGEHFDFFDGALGTLFELCLYACMPSEIDDSGEVRHYFVRMQWDRIASGCFEPEGQVGLFFEVTVSCEETL
ncbi:MAG: hypothetical protein OEU26_00595 [Candidatus Tectomicrobia bacterium]|nr:hypothetical protein [Candidatus Tectomicrobia bacterium]